MSFEQELVDMVGIYAKSVNELDSGLIDTVWDASLNPSFVHPRGYQTGLDDIVAEFYMNTMGRFSRRELRPRDISVDVHGDTAVVFFYWDFTAYFKEDGSRMDSHGRETQVYVRTGGGWKLVHVHYSGMPATGEREGF